MKKNNIIKSSLIAMVIVGSVFTVTACSPVGNSESSETSIPSYIHGDVIDNVMVKDQYGEYMSTKLSPNAKALIYNNGRTNSTLYDAGFTDEDAASAQKFVAEFVAEQGTDSIVLDNAEENDKWIEQAGKYFGGEQKKDLLDNVKSDDSSIIVNRFPLLVRDGKTRVITNSINIYGIGAISAEEAVTDVSKLTPEEAEKINVKNSTGEKYIQVYGLADTVYRVTEENLIKYLVDQQEGKLTKEDLQGSLPEFATGKEKKIINQFEFTYTLQKTDKGWVIVGTNNTFNWNWIS